MCDLFNTDELQDLSGPVISTAAGSFSFVAPLKRRRKIITWKF